MVILTDCFVHFNVRCFPELTVLASWAGLSWALRRPEVSEVSSADPDRPGLPRLPANTLQCMSTMSSAVNWWTKFKWCLVFYLSFQYSCLFFSRYNLRVINCQLSDRSSPLLSNLVPSQSCKCSWVSSEPWEQSLQPMLFTWECLKLPLTPAIALALYLIHTLTLDRDILLI